MKTLVTTKPRRHALLVREPASVATIDRPDKNKRFRSGQYRGVPAVPTPAQIHNQCNLHLLSGAVRGFILPFWEDFSQSRENSVFFVGRFLYRSVANRPDNYYYIGMETNNKTNEANKMSNLCYSDQVQELLGGLEEEDLETGWKSAMGEMVINFLLQELSFVEMVHRHRCQPGRAYRILKYLEEKSGVKYWGKWHLPRD